MANFCQIWSHCHSAYAGLVFFLLSHKKLFYIFINPHLQPMYRLTDTPLSQLEVYIIESSSCNCSWGVGLPFLIFILCRRTKSLSFGMTAENQNTLIKMDRREGQDKVNFNLHFDQLAFATKTTYLDPSFKNHFKWRKSSFSPFRLFEKWFNCHSFFLSLRFRFFSNGRPQIRLMRQFYFSILQSSERIRVILTLLR